MGLSRKRIMGNQRTGVGRSSPTTFGMGASEYARANVTPLTQQGAVTPGSPQGWVGPGRLRCKTALAPRAPAARCLPSCQTIF